jgi:hypothetical protein
MAIDQSGKWWKGTEAEDVPEYLKALTEEGYPATVFRIAKCPCGSKIFRLEFDPDEGGAKRMCGDCGAEHFICDSEEYWEDSSPKKLKCFGKCKSKSANICVGFALVERGDDIRWVYVGHRCTECGVLASCADWKIDYSPSLQLIDLE